MDVGRVWVACGKHDPNQVTPRHVTSRYVTSSEVPVGSQMGCNRATSRYKMAHHHLAELGVDQHARWRDVHLERYGGGGGEEVRR